MAQLDIAAWREAYPQFADVPDARLTAMWPVACQMTGNTDRSRIPYDPDANVWTRELILYALLCHLATLSIRGDLVGNVTSAAEGSVNAGLALVQRANSRWWEQTPCGLTAWQLLAPYRLGGLYVP